MAQYTYNPDVFRVPDERAAREIILTLEGWDTDTRWVKETPYLCDLIGKHLALRPGQLVVDYGCGIGRMAKALIEKHDVKVLGVDISIDMRRLAPPHVGSENFSIVSAPMFAGLVANGFKADAAISIWVIQHALTPKDDLNLLKRGLRDRGGLFIVNNKRRAVPTREGPWASDGLDVQAMLRERFKMQAEGELDPAHVGELLPPLTFWGAYRV